MNAQNTTTHSGHSMPKGDAKALKITGWLTGIYFFIELAIGYYSGSIAVMSDAFHTFSAVGGVLIALAAGHFSAQKASEYATFGFIRAEIMGAFINGIFLFLMAIFVFWMGYQRLLVPIEIPTAPMLIAAFGGLITEAISLKLLFGSDKDNLNMKGAIWHVIQTFVGSIIIIIAAVVIYFTGFYQIDPILGMLFGVVLFWASWGIIKEAMRILLQTVPENFDVADMIKQVEALACVNNVHHIHVWELTTGKTIVSMHVLIDNITDQPQVLGAIQKVLKENFSVYFSTIQVETEYFDQDEAMSIDIKHKKK